MHLNQRFKMSNTVTIDADSSRFAANALNREAGFDTKNSISAGREKSKRISARQKMSSVEKFISLVDADGSEKSYYSCLPHFGMNCGVRSMLLME